MSKKYNNSDLIRREDVVEALYQAIRTTLTGTFTDSMSLAIVMANNLPFVELERTAKVDRDTIFPVKVCGICHSIVDYPNKYCSECGAKLDWSNDERFD